MSMQEFLEGRAGKIAAVGFAIVAVGAVVMIFRNVSTPSEVRSANTRIFVDATTGKPFEREMKPGETIPVRAPSGKDTGYIAELCYWTAAGKVKKDPTAVLLNEQLGKTGPTFCPDCHRLVVGHNPHAAAGRRPPPTEAEYNARSKGGGKEATPPSEPGGRDR